MKRSVAPGAPVYHISPMRLLNERDLESVGGSFCQSPASMEGSISTILAASRLSATKGVRRAAAWSAGGMSFICVKPLTIEAR